MSAISILGFLAGIIVLIFLSYRKASSMLAVPVAAAVVAVLAGLPIVSSMLDTFAGGWSSTFASVCIQFVVCSIFAKVMVDSRAVNTIANWLANLIGVKNCVWTIVISMLVLSFGGMGVGAFTTMYPIALILCQKRNYHKGVAVASVITGGYTMSMTGPFTPATQNVLCMRAFGTPSYAGLIPGIAASAAIVIFGCLFLDWWGKSCQKKGKGFSAYDEISAEDDVSKNPALIPSLLPVVVVLALFNALSLAIEVSLTIGIIVALIGLHRQFVLKEIPSLLSAGGMESALPLIGLSIMAGFGAVVALTPFYDALISMLTASNIHPYILAFLTGNATSFALGSSVSATVLSINSLGELFQKYISQGYDAGNIHRILLMSTGGLDSLPYNGLMVSLFAMWKTNIKESYFGILFTCTIFPILAMAVIAIPLAMLGFN